jgi:hypothetical protein
MSNTNPPKNLEKDVEYYNKDIIKKKQRNNKEYSRDEISASPSSFDLVACAPQFNQEVVLAETLSLREGQEVSDSSHCEYQAPTSPPDLIASNHIKRAVVQYYQNTGSNQLQKHKLKIRLNCDFGEGEESHEFIAALTQDLGNFKKYHPEESRDYIQAWVDDTRKLVKQQFEVKAHLGKFHSNGGWNSKHAQVNQIEPWTACLVWYNRQTRTYWSAIKVYAWEEIFELGSDTLNDRQIKANVKAQKLWYNPQHLNLVRPKTWAQKRFGAKK